jgi:hypothetical protein
MSNDPTGTPNFRTDLRITFMTKNATVFNIRKHLSNFLQALKQEATELAVIPNDINTAPYSDLNNIPTNEDEYNKHFKVTTNKNGNKIDIYHSILTHKHFNKIKFRRNPNTNQYNSTLLEYMNKHKIKAIADVFEQCKTTSVGFFMCIHPKLMHRQMFHESLVNYIRTNIDFENEYIQSLLKKFETKSFYNDKKGKHQKREADSMDNEENNNDIHSSNIPTFEICLGTVSHIDDNNQTYTTKCLT